MKRPILDLCERATWQLGARVSRQWWEQTGIELEEAKKWAEEAEATVLELELEAESDMESKEESGGEEESKGASRLRGA